MAVPDGQWHINSKGFKGTFNVTSSAGGILSGTVDIDIGFTDTLKGVFNQSSNEIIFDRIQQRQGQAFIQTFIGYLYLTKEAIFSGHGAPEPDPTFRLLTGYFIEG